MISHNNRIEKGQMIHVFKNKRKENTMIQSIRKWSWIGSTILILSGSLFSIGCSDDDGGPTGPELSEFSVIQPKVDSYTGGTLAPVIKAQALFDNINDGVATNDYQIISVRSAADYANNHIPGAINIPWRDAGKLDNINKLSSTKKIAVYCYTGHTGAVATTFFNTLGYEAYNLKWGIISWTKDETARVAKAFDEASDAHDYATETTVNTLTGTFDLPSLDFTPSTDENTILTAAIDFVATNMTPVTKAQALFDNLNDGNTANDPIVLSVRSAAHYALGHIPGSYNIPWREIAKEDNLKKLDPSKDIVVYCYTGHTGEVAATALNLLGYNATNMKFGMTAWTRDATIRATSAFNNDVDSHDFPLSTGNTP